MKHPGRILLKRDLPAALLVCHRLWPYYSGRWDLRGSSDELALFFLSGMSSSGKSKRIILRRLLSCRSGTVIYTINSVKHKIVGFKVPMISGLLHSIVFTISDLQQHQQEVKTKVFLVKASSFVFRSQLCLRFLSDRSV